MEPITEVGTEAERQAQDARRVQEYEESASRKQTTLEVEEVASEEAAKPAAKKAAAKKAPAKKAAAKR